MWVADKLIYRGEDDFIRAYKGNELVWEKVMPTNKIYYTTTDSTVDVPYRDGRGGTGEDYTEGFGARIVSNTYYGFGIITFNNDVTKVKFGFVYDNKLETVTLPSNVQTIDTSAFDSCTSLISIKIPEGVTSIGWLAFYGCSSLPTITLPSTLTSIDADAFRSCIRLREVIIMATTPPTIAGDIFRDCPADMLIKVPAGSVNTYRSATGWSDYASQIVSQ